VVTRYYIYIGAETNPSNVIGSLRYPVSSTENPITWQYINYLPYNTTFHWQVVAYNGTVRGKPSDSWSFKTVVARPDIVTLISPWDDTDNVYIRPTLRWEPQPECVVTGYFIYVGDTSNPSTDKNNRVDTVTADRPIMSWTFEDDLDYDTTYYWQIVPFNDRVPGEASDYWHFRTQLKPPGKFTLTSTNRTLTWEGPTDTVTGYHIYRGTATYPSTNEANWVHTINEGATTTWSDTGNLMLGNTYYWQVVAFNGDQPYNRGVSSNNVYLRMPDDVPGQVTLLSPNNNVPNQPIRPTLIWERSTGTVTGYLIYLDTSTEPSSTDANIIQVIPSSTTNTTYTWTFTDDLIYDTQYYWQVVAINTIGDGQASESWSFSTQIEPPRDFTLNTIIPSIRPTLTWTLPGGVVSGFHIFRGLEENEMSLITTIELSTATSWTHDIYDLEYATEYHWQVVAFNSLDEVNNRTSSNSVSFTTPIAPPGKVTLISPIINAFNQSIHPTLTWEKPTDGGIATGYVIYRGTDANPSVSEANIVGFVTSNDITSWTHTEPLEYSRRYHWQVVAFNTTGYGETSDSWSFITQEAPPGVFVLNVITHPSFDDGDIVATFDDGDIVATVDDRDIVATNLRPELSWTLPSGRVSGYHIYRGSSENPSMNEGNRIHTINNEAIRTWIQPSDLLHGTTYHWQVVAFNTYDEPHNRRPSNSVRLTTPIALPGRVILISPNPNAENQPIHPTFTWQRPTGIVSGYRVYIRPFSSTDNIVYTVSGDTATTLTLTEGLEYETWYSWHVVAFNEAGNGAASETRRFMTTMITRPDRVFLLSPNDKATNVSIMPEFIWQTGTGGGTPVRYRLEISLSDGFDDLVVVTTIYHPTTAFTPINQPLEYDTGYHWRVIAINATGESANNTVWSFNTSTAPQFSINPTTHDFGNVIVGENTPPQIFTITNTGGADLNISSVTLIGDDRNHFNLSVTGLPWTIISGGEQSFTVSFSPTTHEAKTANVTINHNVNGSPKIVLLSGTGLPNFPIFNIDPTSHNFGSVSLEQTVVQTFTITNTGITNLRVDTITRSGTDQVLFPLTAPGLPWTIQPGNYQTFIVAFRPTTLGPKSAIFTVSHNAEGSTFVVDVTGTGANPEPVPIISVSPMSHSFGSVAIGQTSEPQTFTVSNTGMANLVVSSIDWVVNEQKQFSLTATGLSWIITPGGNQTFTASFSPTLSGEISEAIRIVHNAASSPTDIAVSGIGLPPPPIIGISPSEYDFGNVPVGQISSVQTFIITNTGGAVLIVEPMSISGSDANDFRFESYNSTHVSINPGSNYEFNVLFTPRTAGDKAVNVLIRHNAAGSPAIVSLTGYGALPIINVDPSSYNFGIIKPFLSSPKQVFTITNKGAADLTVNNITITGLNQNEFELETLPSLPFTISDDEYRTFAVSFNPISSGPKHAVIIITHNASGSQTTVMVEGEGEGVMHGDDIVENYAMTALLGNFPNPFNPITSIRYQVSGIGDQFVFIEIYNIRGQLIRTLLDGSREFGAGRYSVVWDGQDDSGVSVSSGIYFYRMRAGEYSAVRRMILMK
jgi:hypothetical protein